MGGLKKEDSGKKSPSVKSRKRNYIITSAQALAEPHKDFLKGLERYGKEHNSEIIILPMMGRSSREDIYWEVDKSGSQTGGLVEHFDNEKYKVEFHRSKLNNNLWIEQFDVQPQNMDPLTSQTRFSYTSTIFASPKQRMKAISDSNFKMPRLMMTTGACTYPNYATRRNRAAGKGPAERRRRGNIAEKDHIYGAILVEVENEERFHLRNVRADSSGRFVDFGVKYDGGKKSKAELEALVCGDWHVGYTDPLVRDATFEMIRELKPKRLILHDFLDMHSVNYHNDDQLVTGQIFEGVDRDFLSLEKEFRDGRDELLKMYDIMKGGEIYIVASNHHDFLVKYLNQGKLVKDPHNLRIAVKVLDAFLDRKDPIEEGIRRYGKIPERVKFLKRDEDLKVCGYQLAAHGDKGPGGSRGSINTKELQFRRSITCHVHGAEILRNTYVGGTSTPLSLSYTKGNPTNWTNTHALLYNMGHAGAVEVPGTVQMINIINGKWRAK